MDLLKINNGWSEKADEILLEWKRDAQSKEWMHYQASLWYGRWFYVLGIANMFLNAAAVSTLGNFISSYSCSLSGGTLWAAVVSIVLTIIGTFFGGLSTFFNFGKDQELHSGVSSEYEILVRKMQAEYSLPWTERTSRDKFFQMIAGGLDRVTKKSAQIPAHIWRRWVEHKKILDLESNKDTMVLQIFDEMNGAHGTYKDSVEIMKRLATIIPRDE